MKAKQIGTLIAFGKEMQKAGPPPESVSTAVAQEQAWQGTLSAVGSIAAARGVAISNESPGTVKSIHFDSGSFVHQGQVLVELETNVERAQLASSRARRELAEISMKRSRALLDTRSIAQSQLDNDESALKTASADANALEAQIDRKIVRAPFTGRLGIRAVNLGQYLNPGTTLTVLEAIDTVFVDFTMAQQILANLAVGTPVRVTVEGAGTQPADGVVTAIDPEVDANTRTLKVRASVSNQDERLRPGMFVTVAVLLPQKASLVVIPATAIVHAPYGDSVYVVEDKKDASGAVARPANGKAAKAVRQQFVRVGASRGDFVAIVDGVTAGQELVTAGAFKLRNGAPITVTTDVQLDPKLAPHPQNR